MSAVVQQEGGSGGGASQDFDLNLAPIIDAMVVLIAFMLASASYLAIGFLDAGVSAAGVQAKDEEAPPVTVTVELGATQALTLKVTGKANSTTVIPAVDGKADHGEMNRRVGELMGQWKDLKAVTLVAENTIAYREVVGAMESLRKKVPVVLLGGF